MHWAKRIKGEIKHHHPDGANSIHTHISDHNSIVTSCNVIEGDWEDPTGPEDRIYIHFRPVLTLFHSIYVDDLIISIKNQNQEPQISIMTYHPVFQCKGQPQSGLPVQSIRSTGKQSG
jgi:hypothetical protein